MAGSIRIPRALVYWLLLAVVAIVAGALRESLLRPLLGEPWAHRIGTLVLCGILWVLIDRFVSRLQPAAGPGELWAIGALWLALTVSFEFIFGRFATGHSWAELLSAYDLRSGQLWLLVPLTLLIAPPLLGRSRARTEGLAPIERHIEFVPEDRAAEALAWLVELFRERDIRYAAAGGLAARAWGARRPLVDLDFFVHGEDLERVEADLAPYVVHPLTRLESEFWDLSLIRLECAGVPVELSVGEGARYREASTGQWHDACPQFGDCPEREVFGVPVRVLSLEPLLQYKRRVDRAVDRADVASLERPAPGAPWRR